MEGARPDTGNAEPARISQALVLRRRGNAAFDKGEHLEAVRAYTEAIALCSTEWQTWSNRSASHLALKNALYAVYDAEVAFTLAPTERKVYHRLAVAHMALDLKESGAVAVRCLDHLLKTEGDEKQKRHHLKLREEAVRMRDRWLARTHQHAARSTAQQGTSDGVDRSRETREQALRDRMEDGAFVDVRMPPRPYRSLAESAEGRDHFAARCARFAASRIRIADAPGAGRGMFARRRIEPHEIICEEPPCLAANLCQDRCCFACFRPAAGESAARSCTACDWKLCASCAGDEGAMPAREREHRLYCPRSASIDEHLLRDIRRMGCSSSAKHVAIVSQAILKAMAVGRLDGPLALDELRHLSYPAFHRREAYQAMRLVGCLQRAWGLERASWLDLQWYLVATAIALTNCFTFEVDHQDPYKDLTSGACIGLFPLASMINHSCEPNAFWTFDVPERGNSIQVRASRVIRKGEEIRVCYQHAFDRSDVRERRDLLKALYDFCCDCPRCLREESEAQNV